MGRRSKKESCALASEEAQKVIGRHVDSLRTQAGPVEAEDVEAIHDMRVASRRLRAALKQYPLLFKRGRFERFEASVRHITRSLGERRELDVTVGLVMERPNGGPGAAALVQWLDSRRKALTPKIKEAAGRIRSSEFDRTYVRFLEGKKPGRQCYVSQCSKSTLAELKRLRALYRAWEAGGEEKTLHRVRVQFKKLRYTCETFSPLYGKDMKKFIRGLKGAQEALGDWNDYRVLGEYVSKVREETDGTEGKGLAKLARSVEREKQALLERFKKDGSAFFSKENQREARALLGHPTSRCCHETCP